MKLVFYTLYLVFLYQAQSLAVVDKINEKVEAVSAKIKEVEAIPIVQDLKKAVNLMTDAKTGIISSTDTDIEVKMDVCVECSDILLLTENINKVLKKVTEVNPTSYLALEVDNLEALTYITKTVNLSTNQVQCTNSPNENLIEEFRDLSKEELIPIFHTSENIKFTSAHFRNSGLGKTIWLRGTKDDIDKVVKVEIGKLGEIEISYYRINNVKNIKEPVRKDERNRLPDLGQKSSQKPSSRNITDIASGNLAWSESINVFDGEKTQIKAKLGSSVKYEYFVPQKVTLVDFETSIRSGRLDLSSNVKIANDTQEATFKVKQDNLSLSAKVNQEKDYEVGAGAKITIIDDLMLDTYTSYSSNSSFSIDSKVLYENQQLFTSRFERDAAGVEKYSISKETKFDNQSSFSVKVERTLSPNPASPNTNQVWLNFTKKF